jgi:hypothetical protein
VTPEDDGLPRRFSQQTTPPRKLAVLKKAERAICRIFLFSQEKGAAAIYSQGAPVT